MLSKIKDILIIVNKGQLSQYKKIIPCDHDIDIGVIENKIYRKLLPIILKKNGFKDVKRVQKFSIFNDTSNYAPYGEPISLNLIAIK